MTEQELEQQRAANWRTGGLPVRTIEDARSFIDAVGFCLTYPERALPLAPTFIGAYVGSAAGLPDAKHAFADPRAQEATELMVRLLREKAAFELNLPGDANLIVSAALFPYFYALLGDRTPKAPPTKKAQGAAVSELAVRVFDVLKKSGPMSKGQLQAKVAREPSLAALDRALGELWSILKITRVGYTPGEGALWDVLYRWAPEALKEAIDISQPEAISALLSRYLESVVAAEQEEIEQFFSHLVSRSKVREAVNMLLQARELSFVTVGNKSLIRMTPPSDQQRRRHG
ncbi:MAG TPA: crosslink repair DNA glycosylase YcaQ family protein [Candidatus Angelobacter sp.]|nr:crosslink repair DNA glycosylase YcaQ family protein [Candidatus Angelobacter sp.]